MVGLNHHLTTLLAAAGTITTITNAMPFSESKSFTSLQSLQSRDGLSAATSSTDIAALDVPQTQERRQQVLELPKAALANSAITARGETSRKRFADSDPMNPMVRVAMRILGSRSVLRARGAPRKLTISMDHLAKKSITAPAAASPGSASSAGSVDGIAGSAAASADSTSTAAALDQGSVDHYFDEVLENEYFSDGDDNKVLFERGRHPHYNKVIVKGDHDRVRLHGAAKHAKVVVKGDHDRVDVSGGHHGKHGHRGKHGHHRHHGRAAEGEGAEEEGLAKREAGVFAVAGSEGLNARADDEDLVSSASVEDLAARSPRHRDHDRHHHHHHHGDRHHRHHWDDRSVDDASLRLSIEDRSIEDRSPRHGHHGHHKHHHGRHGSKGETLVVKGDNKTIDVRRREIEGAKGRVDIMSPNAEGGDGTRIASLCLGDDFVLNACDDGTPVPIFLAPIPADGISTSESTPASQVLLRIPVFDASAAKEVPYCATFDPRPEQPQPLTAVECAKDGNWVQEHASQIFEYDQGTGVVRPMWNSDGAKGAEAESVEEAGQGADAAGVVGTDEVSRNPAPSMDPPSSMEAGTAGVTSVDPQPVQGVLRRDDATPSSNSPSSTSPDAATKSSATYQAQNVTLLFVPEDAIIKAAPKPTTSAATEIPTTTASTSVAETTMATTSLETSPTPVPTTTPAESPAVAGALETGASTATVDDPAFASSAPAALNVIQVPASGSPNVARSNGGSIDAQRVAESIAAERKAMYAARTAAGQGANPTGSHSASTEASGAQPTKGVDASQPESVDGQSAEEPVIDGESVESTQVMEARAPSMTPLTTEPYNWKFQRDMD